MRPGKSKLWLRRKFTCYLVLLAMLFSMAGGAMNPALANAAGGTEGDPAIYTVTVDSAITGGTVTVDPASGAAGDTITVTVAPDEGKQLVAGSLKYNDGSSDIEITATEGVYSFVLPAANVVVTAQFEEAASASGVWDGSVDVTWYNPTDTVFYIDTPAKMAGLAAIVNGIYNSGATVIGNAGYIVPNVGAGTVTGSTATTWIYGSDDFNGKIVYLTADLDMGGVYDSASGTWSGPNYMPIGGQYCMTYQDGTTLIGASWNGTFDGQGHTVKNIYCSRHAGSLGYEFSQSIGLIGRLGIHDDTVANDNMLAKPLVKNVAVTGYIFGNRSVGGIVGKNGKSKGSVIENCVNYATVKNTDTKGVGGIVGAGWNALTIRNCANFGLIYTSDSNAGGISGSCEAKVFDSYNVGYVDASDTNQAQSLGTNNYNAVWTNCYWLDGSSASNQAVSGSTIGSTITKMDTAESMKTAEFLVALNGDGRTWVADANNINNGYPILRVMAGDTSTLTGISKESEPTKLSYAEGEIFDPTGLAIWANYSDNTRERVANYTISKKTPLEITDTTITVSGTYGGISYSYDFPITVASGALTGIVVTTQPANVLYAAGETFDPTGMVIGATYTNGTTVTLTADQYTIRPTVLTASDPKVTIIYTEAGVTKTVDQQVTVLASGPPVLNGDVYELSTADHLLWFANQVNTGLNNAAKGKLLDYINLSEVSWMPIGNKSSRDYAGTFDGNGKTVTLNISTTANRTALFGSVKDGTVKDLTVAGTISGGQYTAGIVANARGAAVIQNCVNNAKITGSTYQYTGGIVAYATGTAAISGCTNNGTVQGEKGCVGGIAGWIQESAAVSGCVNNGAVTGPANVGGIVGHNYGGSTIIRNSGNTGDVTARDETYSPSSGNGVGGVVGSTSWNGTIIDKCYNSGAVSGNVVNVGGVVGYLPDDTAILKNTYNTGSVTSTCTSADTRTGGVAGYTSKGCTVQNTYNAGSVVASNTGAFTAGVIGYADANTNLSNNYYLDTTATRGLGRAEDNVVSKTSGELKSVEFLTALNGEGRAWVADINNINNGYPVLRIQPADAATLISISKESDPAKLSYVIGQTFDPAGLIIWANYSDGTREKVTNYTISKTTALEITDTTITVSGTCGGMAYSYDFPITVAANALASIAIAAPPNDLVYCAGETFNPAGMVITAIYTNGTSATLTSNDYTISLGVLSTDDTKITISYTEGGVTKTVDQAVTVLASAPTMDSDNAYKLSTVEHMLWFANQVNVRLNNTIKGKLLNDIDLSGLNWEPIGTGSAYAGDFDGNGKTLTLAINRSAIYTGLFGSLDGGTVKDLTVAGTISGGQYTAGIAGYVKGVARLENCVNNATVTGASTNVGGIAGRTDGGVTVTGCTNNCAVTGTHMVGGIVGYNKGALAISKCANTGAVTATTTSAALSYSVGGIVGYASSVATIDQCYNSGAVSGGVLNVGGVIGYLNIDSSKVTNSYNTGSVTSTCTSSDTRTGGVAGYTSNGCTVQNCYNAGAITVSNTGSYTTGVIGYAKGNTNVSNNYYLNTTASIGLGYATDNTVSKTSDELKALAPTLGEYFKAGGVYPILAWQETPAPETYNVTVDNAISGGTVAVEPTSGIEGTAVTVTVTPDAGKQLAAGSLQYTADGGSTYTEITATEGMYSFNMPAANVTVTAQFEDFTLAPKYTVTAVEDGSVYVVGETGGISTMTVKEGVIGLKYFGTQIAPVIEHAGREAVVFVHLRNGLQLSINVTRADFDLLDEAQAGFNVQAGDVVRVYIVDDLTNDLGSNSIVLQ